MKRLNSVKKEWALRNHKIKNYSLILGILVIIAFATSINQNSRSITINTQKQQLPSNLISSHTLNNSTQYVRWWQHPGFVLFSSLNASIAIVLYIVKLIYFFNRRRDINIRFQIYIKRIIIIDFKKIISYVCCSKGRNYHKALRLIRMNFRKCLNQNFHKKIINFDLVTIIKIQRESKYLDIFITEITTNLINLVLNHIELKEIYENPQILEYYIKRFLNSFLNKDRFIENIEKKMHKQQEFDNYYKTAYIKYLKKPYNGFDLSNAG